MANIIKAGNAAGGLAVTPDNTGILQIKTGSGAGTTALTIDTSQNATLAAALAVTGALSAASMTSGGSPVATTAGFISSLTATGYQKFPGGLIIQWVPAAAGTRSWAIPFPTTVLCAVLGPTTNGGVTDNMYISAVSTTSVTTAQFAGSAVGYVLGIGY
jgi:hypothetical protein